MKTCENCGHANVCIENNRLNKVGKVVQCNEWMPIISPEQKLSLIQTLEDNICAWLYVPNHEPVFKEDVIKLLRSWIE